ncbi:hypothetical protein MEI_00523 [Bartonella vinsonii subsp. arupensis Pm136co]|uniref:Peptidase M17 leucyl aminopeptidase N-terminal domain-containing protein n=1 Tax=Bartonella vinsonii subsp. arupensis Pm136co TaxID=1094561 RepID=A0ABN0GQR9_BARVI|nr:hypothetical protein MEI_00523 [Bartonella vinsonii subsp. arupensis Pm136co]
MDSHHIHFSATRVDNSFPILLVNQKDLAKLSLDASTTTWMKVNDFIGKAGQILFIPHENGQLKKVLFGLGNGDEPFITGLLAKNLPAGHWHLEGEASHEINSYLGLAFGSYQFNRYRQNFSSKSLSFYVSDRIDFDELQRIYKTVFFVRDLINIPANDMNPDTLEEEARQLGKAYGADVQSICGDALLTHNFPMIYAVGRASSIAPRLIDLH